ncbi:MAG: hypothetical protein HQ490_02895 [Lutibacter sp.]|nr:hypothetical protein [Lutibacter sp.]
MKIRLYFLYLIIFFLLPGALIFLLNLPYQDTFKVQFSAFSIAQLLCYSFILGLMIFFIPEKKISSYTPVYKELSIILLLLSPLYLFYSVLFFLDYGISFRQVNRLGDVSILMKVIILSRNIFVYILLYLLDFLRSKKSYLFKSIFLIYTFSLFLTSNAAYDYIILVILLLSFFSIDLYLKNTSLFFKIIIFPLTILISFFSIIYIGIANKIGNDLFFDLILNIDNYSVLYSDMILRQSVNLVSANKVIEENFLIGDLNFFRYYFSNLGYIFDRLFSRDVEIYTLPRINYFKIFLLSKDSSISGASPGFIGTLLYFPYFLPGLVIGSAFFIKVYRIWQQMTKNIHFKLFSILLFVFCFIPIFDNIYGYFLIFDFNFLNVLILWFLHKRI